MTKPSQATVHRLYALSGNRCAFPKCTTPLVIENSCVSDVCHIKAASPGGPRYDSTQDELDRHGFDNLLLLCKTHHKVVDDDDEAYSIERLIRMKTEHEAKSERLSDDEAGHGAHLLLNQVVNSVNQSGGIAAHTVNAHTINFNGATPIPAGAGQPNWTIAELFRHMRPTLSALDDSTQWAEVGGDVLDKLATGQLVAWGRKALHGGAKTAYSSLAPIDPLYWQSADFNYVFLLDGHERDTHVRGQQPGNLDYGDIHFNRERACAIWPHSLLASWPVRSIELEARYFNASSDEAEIGCRFVAIYDSHIETVSQGAGLSSYRRLVEQAYVLVAGIDTKTIETLGWQPTRIGFADPSGAVRSFFLTQRMDTSNPGRVKFFMDDQPTITPQPISPALLERANATFGDRLNQIIIGMGVPAPLRWGPTLILQAIPASAFVGREIGSSRSELMALGPCFMPDGFQRIEGRSRQEGWVWHQPGEKVENLQTPVVSWHSSLDWDGFVQIVLNLEEAKQTVDPITLAGYPLERIIVKTLESVAEGYEKLQLRSPVIVRVTLNNVLGCRLIRSTGGHAQGFDRPCYLTESVGISTMTKPLGKVLRPILESIWRGAGWSDGSPSFGRGDWEGYKNPYPYM